MLGRLLDKLGAWRTARAPKRPAPSEMDHTINIAGFGGHLTDKQVRWLCQPGRKVTLVEWRGCMADARLVVSEGTIVGGEVYAKHGFATWRNNYKGEWGPLIKYPEGPFAGRATWSPTSRLRFVGTWPYTIEEWT